MAKYISIAAFPKLYLKLLFDMLLGHLVFTSNAIYGGVRFYLNVVGP